MYIQARGTCVPMMVQIRRRPTCKVYDSPFPVRATQKSGKRRKRTLAFPKTFSFGLRFCNNFVTFCTRLDVSSGRDDTPRTPCKQGHCLRTCETGFTLNKLGALAGRSGKGTVVCRLWSYLLQEQSRSSKPAQPSRIDRDGPDPQPGVCGCEAQPARLHTLTSWLTLASAPTVTDPIHQRP